MNLRFQRRINEEYSKWLYYSKEEESALCNEPNRNNSSVGSQNKSIGQQKLGFDTSTTFENEDQNQFIQRQSFQNQNQYQSVPMNNKYTPNPFMIHPDKINSVAFHNERYSERSIE